MVFQFRLIPEKPDSEKLSKVVETQFFTNFA